MTDWIPDAGDLVWVQLNPQAGREQAGHRPAVVLTTRKYNWRSGLMICVPVTTRIKNYPFEVAIAGSPAAAALVDHVRSIDWRARRAEFKSQVSAAELQAIRDKLKALIG